MWIRNAHLYACHLDADVALPVVGEGVVHADIHIAEGRIDGIIPPTGDVAVDGDVDQRDGMVWPGFVDVHTHLDKGHIWPRSANPDGTFDGALNAVMNDRGGNWSADDLLSRMDFSLRCAEVHGTVALRTHLDCFGPQTELSWKTFDRLRSNWSGRIDLQGAALTSVDVYLTDEAAHIADVTAAYGGVLGCVTYPLPGLERGIAHMFDLADARGLDLDLHVDETLDPDVNALDLVVAEALKRDWVAKGRRIAVGHCCSLSMRSVEAAHTTLDGVAEAGIDLISLPMCNLYLQSRNASVTPRYRGVTLLQEAASRGINVSVASDNTRDPFYAYGDLDMLEVYREATRIGHLDHPVGDWPNAVAGNPARTMGLKDVGRIAVGGPADLVLFNARSSTELLSRPQSDRRVMRSGAVIAGVLPDYRELDAVLAC